MKHELPALPFTAEGISPFISQTTLEFHHGKHHLTYVNNLNNLIVGTKFEEASLETIIKEADGSIFNNGAQVWNHSLYFDSFSCSPKPKPEGKLLEAIIRDFGSLEHFVEKFTQAALTLFGSGWAWLAADAYGNLEISQEPNAGNPLRKGLRPLLTCDVWEHAYYLDYQNRRVDYLKNFWVALDWGVIEKRFGAY